jgi:hypothetical protein
MNSLAVWEFVILWGFAAVVMITDLKNWRK